MSHVDDAVADAAPSCPPLGTAPQFRASAVTLATSCDHYVAAAGTAMAWCFDGATQSVIAQGRNDSLAAAPGVMPVVASSQLELPRIYPEGLALIVRERDLLAMPKPTMMFDGFSRDGTGPWTHTGTVTIPAVGANDPVHDQLSMPAGSPGDRRAIYTNTFEDPAAFYELQDTGAGWQPFGAKYTAGQLEPATTTLIGMREPNLTPDGLRLVFVGVQPMLPATLFYSDRLDLASRFRAAVPLMPALPNVSDAYLTADCGQLFYSEGDGHVYRLEP